MLRFGANVVHESGASIEIGKKYCSIAFTLLIHCRQGLMLQLSLQPFMSTRQPLQVIIISLADEEEEHNEELRRVTQNMLLD